MRSDRLAPRWRGSRILRNAIFNFAVCGTLGLLGAQNTTGPGAAKAPPTSTLAKAKHYAISYLTPTEGDAGTGSKPPGAVLQSIGDGLAKKLSTKGLVRVPALDVQCCTIQLTLLGTPPDTPSESAKSSGLAVRVALLDIDQQQLYTKDFRSGAKSSAAAADELTSAILADEKILSSLKAS